MLVPPPLPTCLVVDKSCTPVSVFGHNFLGENKSGRGIQEVTVSYSHLKLILDDLNLLHRVQP
jgi:hypothetical protein